MTGPFSTKVPGIGVRGVRQTIPPGHVVGRISKGDGAAELIPFAMLNAGLVNAGQGGNYSTGVSPTHDTLWITAPGLFSASQQFALAPAVAATLFPSTTKSSSALWSGSPHGSVTFYLVSNLPLFLQQGHPNGVLATITGAAGSGSGTVTYNGSGVQIPAGLSMTLVMPSSADATFSGLTLEFAGDPNV